MTTASVPSDLLSASREARTEVLRLQLELENALHARKEATWIGGQTQAAATRLVTRTRAALVAADAADDDAFGAVYRAAHA